jgi:hypothetical protein
MIVRRLTMCLFPTLRRGATRQTFTAGFADGLLDLEHEAGGAPSGLKDHRRH